jgi:VanZ family protein
MFKRPLLPGLIWTLLIAVLTLMPGNYIPKVLTFLDWLSPDKIVHLILFGVYVYLLAEGFVRHDRSWFISRYPVWSSLIIGIIFAFFTEVMQMFVIPGRYGSIYDMLADILGSILGITVWYIIQRNEKKNLRSSENYN